MASIISTHNSKILTPTTAPLANSKLCNCRTPSNCPLNGLCLTESIVYKATVSAATKPKMVYYGLTENRFKERYNDHTSSFRTRKYSKKLLCLATYGNSKIKALTQTSSGRYTNMQRPTSVALKDVTYV